MIPGQHGDSKGATPQTNASRLFGWDIFISFALGPPPRGSRAYASDLARKLRERDFTVFFSEDEASPGTQRDRTLELELKRSRLLVVIANRGTVADPRWVRVEVTEFRRVHPDRPVIPINIGGALNDGELGTLAEQWLAFRDKIWIDESQQAADQGVASDDVVARLAMAPRGVCAARRWRATVAVAFVLLAVTTAAAVRFAFSAREAERAATAGRLAAESQLAASRDPGLSTILALHAYQEQPIASSKAALLGAVARYPRLIGEIARLTDADGRELPVHTLAFSPNGRELAIGAEDGRITFVDMQRQRIVAELDRAHEEGPGQLLYSSDGRLLASVGRKPDIRVWDASQRTALADLHSNDPAWSINVVAFNPSGSRLASVGADLLIWDMNSFVLQANLHNDTQFVYNDVVWTPDGSHVLAVTTAGLLDRWNPATQQRMQQRDLQDLACCGTLMAGSADGRFLMMSARDESLLLWDAQSGSPELVRLSGHTKSVARFAFSGDSKVAASAGYDGTVRLWRTGSIEVKYGAPMSAHRGIVRTVAFEPGSHRLVSAGDDGKVYLWDIDAEPAIAQALKKAGGEVSALAFSADGRFLFVPNGRELEVWDVRQGAQVESVASGHRADLTALAVSADGRSVASLSGYGDVPEVMIWSLSGSKLAPRTQRQWPATGTVVAFLEGEDAVAIQDSEGIGVYGIPGLEALARIEREPRSAFHHMTYWSGQQVILFSDGKGRINAMNHRLEPARQIAGLPPLTH